MESILLLDAWFSGGGRLDWKEEDKKLYNWETETISPEAGEFWTGRSNEKRNKDMEIQCLPDRFIVGCEK